MSVWLIEPTIATLFLRVKAVKKPTYLKVTYCLLKEKRKYLNREFLEWVFLDVFININALLVIMLAGLCHQIIHSHA